MTKHLLPFFVLMVAAIGCTDNPPKPSANGNTRSTSVSEKTYPPDLAGQVIRVRDEGVDDSHVRANIAAVDKTISYELLKKNADKFAGKEWAFKGKILEINEQEGVTQARIALDDWGNNVIFVGGPI